MVASKMLVDMSSGVTQAEGCGVVYGLGADMVVDVDDGNGSCQ
jgi:hypothetical protein